MSSRCSVSATSAMPYNPKNKQTPESSTAQTTFSARTPTSWPCKMRIAYKRVPARHCTRLISQCAGSPARKYRWSVADLHHSSSSFTHLVLAPTVVFPSVLVEKSIVVQVEIEAPAVVTGRVWNYKKSGSPLEVTNSFKRISIVSIEHDLKYQPLMHS